MADHEDHNYYTRSNRESQIPDYDVSLAEPSESILPSFTYRHQSSERSPKRPIITSSFDQSRSDTRPERSSAATSSSLRPDAPQDPHEFYRQYHDSFQRRPESVYDQFDMSAQSISSTASVRQQRSPVSNRMNGYNSSPVSARWNRSVENRKTPSPVADKAASRQHNAVPRGKGEIQALVNKFNSTGEEPPAMARPTVRTSSATHLSASNNLPTPSSFKSRASFDNRSNISALGTRPTRDSVTGKLGGGGSGQTASKIRRPSQVTGSNLASQSMTNLSPVTTTSSAQPLFGEILQDTFKTDLGYGIPSNRRRGSEGSLQRSSTIFQNNDDPPLSSSAEPVSPSTWYLGAAPSLDGINLNRPLPPKKTGMHKRSRSDLGMTPLSLASHSAGTGKPVSILSPPQELPTPPLSSAGHSPLPSRLPKIKRNASTTSDSGHSSGRHTPTKFDTSDSASGRGLRSPQHAMGMRTPRRSPRYRNPSPPRQSSPTLDALVADTSKPLKSPPLRSSRPRISVADASTAASRARSSNKQEEQPKPRPPSKITNLPPNANMEQRRQMIRRDFTKSWHEKEERFKRQSAYMQSLGDIPMPEWPSPGKSNASYTSDPSCSSPETTEAYATPAEKPLAQPELTIATTSEPSNSFVEHLANGDSPTLGTADFPPVARLPVGPSEPVSAVTADTIETFFEQHSEDSSFRQSQSGPGAANNPTTPRVGLLSPRSEFDDSESIQIMLGDSPTLDRRFVPSVEPPKTAVPRIPTPKLTPDHDTPVSQHRDIAQASAPSTNTIDKTENAWVSNPHANEAANQDRESGATIEALLDKYQESEPRRLFSQSPGLARAGGWDGAKVTRMYLQSRSRKTPELADRPPAPVFRSAEDDNILQPAKLDLSGSIIPRSRSPRMEKSVSQDTTTEPSPQPSLEVPRSAKDHRASLSHRNDFVDNSPSMLDWMHSNQPSEVSAMDPSTLRTNTTENLLRDIANGVSSVAEAKQDNNPELPHEMPADTNTISELHSSPQRRKNSSIDLSRINDLESSPSRRAEMSALGSTPPRKPVPASKSLQAIMNTKPLPEVSPANLKSALSAAVNGNIQGKRPSLSSTPSETTIKVNGSSADLPQDPQSKRLRRRLNIIKELIDTESTYGQDMTVVVDIYKGTCNMVLNSAQDERALFINAPEIVAFSTVFLDALKSAAKSVYILPKSKRWRSKRDSSATQESGTEDQTSLHGLDLSDEERDRLTNIGSAFLDHLPEMERVYTEFLKNSEAANTKLKALQEDEKVKVWLDECCAYAKDLTTAWSLDSLLVKPFQRITKYPLLLKELCDVTPENHPDFVKLDTAAREISGVSKRINDAKRRMEMVEKVSQAEKNKRKDESRLNLQKAFGRRSDKYRSSAGLQEQFQDREYNQISDKFGTHFFKLQIVMRDVEMYINDVQAWVNKFNSVTVTVEDYLDISSGSYPEIESKWRRFRSNMKDMHNTALVDHVNNVRRYVVDPMATLLKLHDGPQRLMEKRKKRIPDYVKYRAMKERTEKIDKKTSESAELFLAVNDTLKDELPKLFEMTSRLVEACLNNFVQLQLQWQSVWKRKMIQAIELAEVPRSFADIVSDFSGDFRYTEAHVLSLGICNGSVIADGTNFLSTISQQTTLVGDSRRPSTTATVESASRIRAASNATSASIDPARNRGFSGPSAPIGPSPMLPSPDLGRPTEGFGLGSHLTVVSPRAPTQGLRVRASSTASNRSPVTPETATFRQAPAPAQSQGYARPATSTGRGYEAIPSQMDVNRQQPALDNRYQMQRENSSQYATSVQQGPPSSGFRSSGIFNSAMPMSDSPKASSPVNDNLASNEFNVLFLAASVYEFNIDRARREAGYPYLTYVAGEIFDVIAEKGELWLAKNQDDEKNQVGWIWNKHFAKLAS